MAERGKGRADHDVDFINIERTSNGRRMKVSAFITLIYTTGEERRAGGGGQGAGQPLIGEGGGVVVRGLWVAISFPGQLSVLPRRPHARF